MTQRNVHEDALTPGFSHEDYVHRMTKLFCETVINVGECEQFPGDIDPVELAQYVLSLQYDMMVVTAFLIENEDYLDINEDWLTSQLDAQVNDLDAQRSALFLTIRNNDAVAMAYHLVGAYRTFLQQAIAGIEQHAASKSSLTAEQLSHKTLDFLTLHELLTADANLGLYLSDADSRLSLHQDCLPVFYTYEPDQPRAGAEPIEGESATILNYDHLASFAVALGNALLRGDELSTVENILARNYDQSLRCMLVALYEDLPRVAEYIDEMMEQYSHHDYRTSPFSERVEHWSSRSIFSNRPLPKGITVNHDCALLLEEVEFTNGNCDDIPNNPHPFSPYIPHTYDGDEYLIDVDVYSPPPVLASNGRTHIDRRTSNCVSLDARTVRYLEAPGGISVTLSAN